MDRSVLKELSSKKQRFGPNWPQIWPHAFRVAISLSFFRLGPNLFTFARVDAKKNKKITPFACFAPSQSGRKSAG
jgi:hypothetical protein